MGATRRAPAAHGGGGAGNVVAMVANRPGCRPVVKDRFAQLYVRLTRSKKGKSLPTCTPRPGFSAPPRPHVTTRMSQAQICRSSPWIRSQPEYSMVCCVHRCRAAVSRAVRHDDILRTRPLRAIHRVTPTLVNPTSARPPLSILAMKCDPFKQCGQLKPRWV